MERSDRASPIPSPPHDPASTDQLPSPPPQRPDAASQPPSYPRRSGKKLVAIGAAVLLVAGAIAGIVLAGGGGGPKSAPTRAHPPTPAAPVGLTATAAVAPFAVTLSWSEPSGSVKILGYKIFRDQLEIAAVPVGTTTYTDGNVFPGKTFTYGVVTRGDGVLESERVSAQVDVPVPAMTTARVSGTFNVKFRTVSQSGYVGSLGRFTAGWEFNPKCDHGACSVIWKDVSEKSLKTTLRRKGGNYSGSDAGKFLGHCGHVMGTTTVTLAFHITKARATDGEWLATKLVGTVTEHHPSQLGCTSGGATFNVSATLAG